MSEIIITTAEQLKQVIVEIFNKQIIRIPAENTQTLDEELLNFKQTLLLLKISKPTLFKKMKDGTIPYTRIGRRLLFKKSEVINSLKRRN